MLFLLKMCFFPWKGAFFKCFFFAKVHYDPCFPYRETIECLVSYLISNTRDKRVRATVHQIQWQIYIFINHQSCLMTSSSGILTVGTVCKQLLILFLSLHFLIEKVHLDDLDLYVITFCCVSNVSLTLIISIETY